MSELGVRRPNCQRQEPKSANIEYRTRTVEVPGTESVCPWEFYIPCSTFDIGALRSLAFSLRHLLDAPVLQAKHQVAERLCFVPAVRDVEHGDIISAADALEHADEPFARL